METISDSKLAQIDWAMLSTDVLSSTWYLNTMEQIKEILNFIVEDEESPNTERLLRWFPHAIVYHNGPHYLTLGAKRRGNPLFSVYIEYKTNKIPYAYLIYQELNKLRSKLIHFPYCYMYIKAMSPIIDDDTSLTWMIKSDEKDNSNHLLLERIHGERLSVFIRKQEGNLETYISIFLQTIMALQYAYNEMLFVHGDLTISHIMVEENVNPEMWIPLGENFIRGSKIIRIVDILCPCTKTQRKYSIYDIYKFAITYLYEIACHRSSLPDSTCFLNILVNFLLEIHIPIYIITLTRTLSKPIEEIYNMPLPKNLKTMITYESAIRIFLRLCSEKIDIDNIYCVTMNDTKTFMDLSKPFTIPYQPHPLDGYIYAIAEDIKIDDMENGKNIKQFNEKVISDLMENINKTYRDIHQGFYNVRSIPPNRVSTLSPINLNDHISTITSLFYDLLSVRILLDELRTRLKHREAIMINDLRNYNILNYIRENDARLLRLMGENMDLYEQSYRIVDHMTFRTIKQIWKILNNPLIGTRQ